MIFLFLRPMIYRFALALCLCVLSLTAFAQTPAVGTVADQPFKKANVILVQTPDSPAVALKKFGALLVQQGYTIKKLDSEFLTLITDPRAMSFGWKPTLTIKARATATCLRLTGDAFLDMAQLGSSTNAVQFTGVEGSVYKGCFREIEKVAKLYPAATIKYSLE